MPAALPSRRHVVAVAAAGLAATVAGCTGGAPSPAPSRGGPGAEPAVAPAPSTRPAGLVVPVGYAPEGVLVDPATGLVVVGVRRPDRVLVLDPGSLAVRRAVTVPGTVRHLGASADGGTVLVPNEAADSLVEVDLRTGRTRSTPVGHGPHDATGTAAGEVLVADEFGGSLTVLRAGRVVHTFADLRQPGGVVADGRTALVVDVGDYSVTSYDLDRMVRVARVAAGDGPTHGTLARPGLLAVADTRGGALLLFSVDPLRQVARVDLPGSPYGLAGDPVTGTVWVTLTARNEVVGPRRPRRHPP